MTLQSINPATGKLSGSLEQITDAGLEASPVRAEQSFRTCRKTSFAELGRGSAIGIRDGEPNPGLNFLFLE
jgi:hypothetical protein